MPKRLADNHWLPASGVIVWSIFSVPYREGGVEACSVHYCAQGDVACCVATEPSCSIYIDADGRSVDCAQVVIEAVVAAAVGIARRDDELCIGKTSITIVAEHHIGPEQVQHTNIAKIDDVTVVAIDIVVVGVQIVERNVKERSKLQSQDAVDHRCSNIGAIVSGDHRAIVA